MGVLGADASKGSPRTGRHHGRRRGHSWTDSCGGWNVLRPLLVLATALAAFAAPAAADPPAMAVLPSHVGFGRQPIGSETMASFAITNRSDEPVLVTIEQVEVWDDFSPGQTESTCPLGDSVLPARGSCVHLIGFRPSLFFLGRETSRMRVIGHDVSGTTLLFQRDVKLTGTAVP